MDFNIKNPKLLLVQQTWDLGFTGGERIDCAISELDLNKRKVTLSIKLLEEIEKKEALEKYGSEGSEKFAIFLIIRWFKEKDKEKNNKRIIKLAVVKSKLLKQLSKNYPNFLKRLRN